MRQKVKIKRSVLDKRSVLLYNKSGIDFGKTKFGKNEKQNINKT